MYGRCSGPAGRCRGKLPKPSSGVTFPVRGSISSDGSNLIQAKQAKRKSFLRRIILAAGSPSAGIVLIVLIVGYLCLASTVPDALARLIGGSPASLYRHPLLVLLAVALCAGVLLASWTRLAVRWSQAGAWCSHLGVLVLAGGVCLYATRSVGGTCVTSKSGAGWTDIRGFYADGTYAVYASTAPGAQAVQTEIPPGRLARLGRDPLELASPADGVKARATGFRESESLIYFFDLIIRDGDQARRTRLRFGGAYETDDYQVIFHPQATAEMVERLLAGPGSPEDLRLTKDTVIVLTGLDVEPTVAVARPDGSLEHGKVDATGTASVRLAGRTVKLVLLGSGLAPAEGLRDVPGFSGPALRVEFSTDGGTGQTWVPFAGYPPLADPVRVDLPGGRDVFLCFSRAHHPLPLEIRAIKPAYLTYPGSVIPKDYRCDVSLSDGARETISLNNPLRLGEYQISQGSWFPSGGDPQHIVLLVRTRPGLELIWIGCVLIVAGLPYAFYVKPLILKRKRGAGA